MSTLRDDSNFERQRRLREIEELIQAASAKGDTPTIINLGREAKQIRMQMALERTRKYRVRERG